MATEKPKVAVRIGTYIPSGMRETMIQDGYTFTEGEYESGKIGAKATKIYGYVKSIPPGWVEYKLPDAAADFPDFDAHYIPPPIPEEPPNPWKDVEILGMEKWDGPSPLPFGFWEPTEEERIKYGITEEDVEMAKLESQKK